MLELLPTVRVGYPVLRSEGLEVGNLWLELSAGLDFEEVEKT